jgi:hypothetical protein
MLFLVEYQMMDEFHNCNNSKCHKPSSEPFRMYYL